MPKGKRGGRSKKGRKSESLVYGMRVRVNPRMFPGRDLASVASEAKARFLEDGEETDGVRIIGRWKNPNNRNPRHANWKYSSDADQSLEGFFETILQKVGATSSSITLKPVKPEQLKRAKSEARSAAAKKGAATKHRKMLDRATEIAEKAEVKRKKERAQKRKARFL